MKTPPQRRKLQNEMQLARGRLRGALNETMGSEDDSTAAEEDLPHRGRPPKHLSTGAQRELQSPRSSRQSSLSPGKYLTPTKRRKREQQQGSTGATTSGAGSSTQSTQQQKIQAESFVMKLFDRSLDLSKYTEQTSLYPICRAWMANQPRNPSIRSYREQRSPSPVEREHNAEEFLAKLRCGEVREVRAMPAPQAGELPKLPTPQFAGAEAAQRLKELDNVLAAQTESKTVSKEELLDQHLGAWKHTKANWMKHTKIYQKRYELNHLIIQELFKP